MIVVGKENDQSREDYRGSNYGSNCQLQRAKSKEQRRKGEEEDSVRADWKSFVSKI